MSIEDLKQRVIEAEQALRDARDELARAERRESARVAVDEAVAAYAETFGMSIKEAWRALSPLEEAPVDPPNAETVKEYKQPLGAHDAYKKGDRIRFDGAVYESLIDANVWTPLAYPQGWKKI